jgi:hypothetical protein
MPKAKAKRTTTPAAVPNDKATMVVTVYDGSRQPIQGKDFLIRIFDGFQNKLFDDYKSAPTTVFRLPYRDNLQDNCTVLATGDGHVDAGFTPVKLSLAAVAMVDLMLLQDDATFKFLSWDTVKTADAVVASFISLGSNDAEAQACETNRVVMQIQNSSHPQAPGLCHLWAGRKTDRQIQHQALSGAYRKPRVCEQSERSERRKSPKENLI